MSLNSELKLLQTEVLKSLPSDIRNKLNEENKKLLANFVKEKTLQEGDRVPDVFFRDKHLKPVYLKDILEKHHVVLSFSRGTWCPYCNLELQSLNKIKDKIEEKGGRLIGASPELYEFSEKFIVENNINFDLLTDLSNKAADKFGLVFELSAEYREIYKQFNISLNKLNGENNWTLPVPATFIIEKNGIIRSTYVNADYTQRMEPDDILSVMDKLKS